LLNDDFLNVFKRLDVV